MLRILVGFTLVLAAATSHAAGLDDIRLGMQAERDSHYKTAIGHYTNAIASRRLNKRQLVGVLYNRGLVRVRLNRVTRAINDYNRAIKIAPKNGIGYYYRGLAYEKKGDRAHARRDFQAAARYGYKSGRLSAKLKAYNAIAAVSGGTSDYDSVWVVREAANVRRGPSTKTDRVLTLPEGATVTVVGTTRRSNWRQVSHHGKVLGYVYKPLLRRVR